MKKLIAIVISFIFIFEGAGYCLRAPLASGMNRINLVADNAREFIQSRGGKAPEELKKIRIEQRERLKFITLDNFDAIREYIQEKINQAEAKAAHLEKGLEKENLMKVIPGAKEALVRLIQLYEDKKIFSFKALAYKKEDYALGYGDGNEIGLAEEFLNMDMELLAEYMFHEAVCFKIRHWEARHMQSVLFPENYIEHERRWSESKLKLILRDFIDKKARIRNGIDLTELMSGELKDYKGVEAIFIDETEYDPNDYSAFIRKAEAILEKSEGQIIFYGDYDAIERLANFFGESEKKTKGVKDRFTVLVTREKGMAGLSSIPEGLNEQVKSIMAEIKEEKLLVDIVPFFLMGQLYTAGYTEAGESLKNIMQKKTPIFSFEAFKGLVETFGQRHSELEESRSNRGEADDYFASCKLHEESSNILKAFGLAGQGLTKDYLRKYLLETKMDMDKLFYIVIDIFGENSGREESILNEILWDTYLDESNTSKENRFFFNILIKKLNWNNIHMGKTISKIARIFKEGDLNKTYKAMDVLLRLRISKEDNDTLLWLIQESRYKKEIITSFCLLNRVLFGIKEKFLGSRGYPDYIISYFEPEARDLYWYLLKIHEINQQGGNVRSGVDDRILYYTVALDNYSNYPGQKGYSWFTALRNRIHRNASSNDLRIVKAVLYFWKEMKEEIINDMDSLLNDVKKDIGDEKTAEYSVLINNMLKYLKSQGSIKSVEGDSFLEEILKVPEDKIISALKKANPVTDVNDSNAEKNLKKIEYMIRLYYALNERYGTVWANIIPNIKGEDESRDRYERQYYRKEMLKLTGFMKKDYKHLMSVINTNDYHAILSSIASCRSAIKKRVLFDKITEEDKERLLELDHNMFLLGREMIVKVFNDINQCRDLDSLKAHVGDLVSMARFISASGLGGVDFEQFIDELECGDIKYSQLHDLTRALKTELHKATRKINDSVRFSIKYMLDHQDAGYYLTDELKQKFGEDITEKSKQEIEDYIIDNFIRDTGIFALDDGLTAFNDILETQVMPYNDTYAAKRSVERDIDLDEQFFRFGTDDVMPRQRLLSLWSKKGLNLVIMTEEGIDVPPGVVISSKLITQPKIFKSDEFQEKVEIEIEHIRRYSKYPDLKLLLYARSGSAFMLPGLLVTIPNLGMNDKEAEELAALSKDKWFAYDTYAGFIRSFAVNIIGIPEEYFQEAMDKHGKPKDELTGDEMERLCRDYKDIVAKYGKGQAIPETMIEQVMMAIDTVYDSWDSEDARAYRARHKISQEWGSVVILQKGVFGNLNPTEDGKISGTGAAALRVLPDGREVAWGRFRFRSIGEQIMTGAEHNYLLLSNYQRTHDAEQTLEELKPELYQEILEKANKLKKIFGNNQLFEFTVELNKVWTTQSNDDFIIDEYPEFIDSADNKPIGRGHGVSGGALRGWAANSFESAKTLLEKYKTEKPGGIDGVILFLDRVNPEMINSIPEGVHLVARIISVHAETLAQRNGITAVYGVAGMEFNSDERSWYIGSHKVADGAVISIDGHENQLLYHNSGKIFLGSLPIREEPDNKIEIERSPRALGAITRLKEIEEGERAGKTGQGFSDFEKEVLTLLEDARLGKAEKEKLRRYATNYRAILDKIAKRCEGLDFELYGEQFKEALSLELAKLGISFELFMHLENNYLPRTNKYTRILEKITSCLTYEPPERLYPESITVYDETGHEIILSAEDLDSRNFKSRYFIINKPERSIKLVSFEFDGVLENMLSSEPVENIIEFFSRLKSMGLKIALTTRHPGIIAWLGNSKPEIYKFFDYAYEDFSDSNLEYHYVRDLGLQRGEIMHIGNLWLDYDRISAARIHREGFISVLVMDIDYPPVKEIMNKEIDGIMVHKCSTEDMLSLMRHWVSINESVTGNTATNSSL